MEDLKKIVRDFYGKLSAGDIDGAMKFIARDAVDHYPNPIPDVPKGAEGFEMLLRSSPKAFSNLDIEVQDILVDGDHVAVRGAWSGRHTGSSLLGEKPTNREIRGNFAEFIRVEGGKCVERWAVRDDFQVMTSLGVSPTTLGQVKS